MFPIQVTLTINNLTDFTKVQAIVASSVPANDPAKGKYNTANEAIAGVAEKAAADKAATAGKQTVKSQAAASEQPDNAGTAAGGEKTYVLADAQALTKAMVAAGKRSEVVALLEKHDAGANDKGTRVAAKLPEESIAAFCAEAEAELAA